MRHLSTLTTLLCGLLFAMLGRASALAAPSISIYGWPGRDGGREAPDLWLGNDPIIGRLACPPLTRLNLRRERIDELLVRAIAVDGPVWRFELRSGLHWWSGDPVVAADLMRFLPSAIDRAVAARGGGLWGVPAHSIAIAGDATVAITWKTPPLFGPYVLSGIPFARQTPEAPEPRFECVGLHRLRQSQKGLVLEPRPSAKGRAPVVNVMFSAESADIPRHLPFIEFKTATDFSGNPWTRPGDDPVNCRNTVDFFAATMLLWQGQSGPTADPRLRRLLTQVVPRGALLRAGGAGLGELLTAPIARRHPGYDARLPLRPSDLEAASDGLTELGYVRATPTAMRRLPGSTTDLKLSILSLGRNTALIEKVMVDAFQAVGVGLRFVTAETKKVGEPIDGTLGTFYLDWPDADLLRHFHSQVVNPQKDDIPLPWLNDRALDAALERYALSLTRGRPDFTSLKTVHRRLYELEPVTVVLQHKACLEAGGGLMLPKAGIDLLDPDWFRPVVFPANAE